MGETNYLEMKNIDMYFPGVHALKSVSLGIKRGEVVALLGENGAGKSTLMKILSGVYNNYEGEIYIDGSLRRFSDPGDAEKSGVAMIYQELNPFLDLSIAENIYLNRLPKTKLKSIDWKKLYKSAAEVVTRLGMNADVRVTMRSLGASEQQLVAIARALVSNSSIFILDEPTSSLTEKETQQLFNVINEIKSSGKCIIYISHKLDEIFRIADKTVVLRDGNNVGECSATVENSDTIIHMMIGRDIKQMYPINTAQKGEVVFEVRNLKIQHAYAAEKTMIDNIDFSVRKGEILGLAGLVGSGRSEILNAIFGSYRGLYKGDFFLEGKRISVTSPSVARKLGIALLTEDRRRNGVVGIMGIDNNVTLASLEQICTFLRINRKKERQIAERYVDELAIKCSSIKMPVANLSGGNQQKTVLAKWLNTSPKILLLDEPTRGIDVGYKIEIYKIMNQLVEEGITIIWVSSELPELLAISDRIIALHNGKVCGELYRGDISEERVMKLITGAAH